LSGRLVTSSQARPLAFAEDESVFSASHSGTTSIGLSPPARTQPPQPNAAAQLMTAIASPIQRNRLQSDRDALRDPPLTGRSRFRSSSTVKNTRFTGRRLLMLRSRTGTYPLGSEAQFVGTAVPSECRERARHGASSVPRYGCASRRYFAPFHKVPRACQKAFRQSAMIGSTDPVLRINASKCSAVKASYCATSAAKSYAARHHRARGATYAINRRQDWLLSRVLTDERG